MDELKIMPIKTREQMAIAAREWVKADFRLRRGLDWDTPDHAPRRRPSDIFRRPVVAVGGA